jgi:hypothetical protein
VTHATRGVQPGDLCCLDADVLFSAAYRRDTPIRDLWNLPNVRLITSTYAAAGACRNLSQIPQQRELERLLKRMTIVVDDAQHIYPAVD